MKTKVEVKIYGKRNDESAYDDTITLTVEEYEKILALLEKEGEIDLYCKLDI